MIDDNDIAHARQVSIHSILGIHDNGRRQKVICVFHKDRNPSLVIYPGADGYNCFSCGANGHNAIDFIMGLGYSFQNAVEELKQYV